MEVVVDYVNSCASGRIALLECGPVWQLGIIASLVAVCIFFLGASRISSLRAIRSGVAPE